MASALTPEDAGAAGGDEGAAAARSSLRSPSPKLEESQRTLARLREHVNQLKVKFFFFAGLCSGGGGGATSTGTASMLGSSRTNHRTTTHTSRRMQAETTELRTGGSPRTSPARPCEREGAVDDGRWVGMATAAALLGGWRALAVYNSSWRHRTQLAELSSLPALSCCFFISVS